MADRRRRGGRRQVLEENSLVEDVLDVTNPAEDLTPAPVVPGADDRRANVLETIDSRLHTLMETLETMILEAANENEIQTVVMNMKSLQAARDVMIPPGVAPGRRSSRASPTSRAAARAGWPRSSARRAGASAGADR